MITLSNDILVSCSWDKTIRIWNLKTFQYIRNLTEHNDSVNVIIKVTNHFATGSADGVIIVWGFDYKKVTQLEHEGPILSFTVLKDDRLISGSYYGII